MSSFDTISATFGDDWIDRANNNTFRGYYSSDSNLLSVATDADISTGTIITRQCSAATYLIFDIANCTQWLDLSILQLDRLATVSRNTASSPNDFGYSTGTPAIVHESVPLAIDIAKSKIVVRRDRDTSITEYTLLTSAGYYIRVGDQITMGRDPLTVRTVDSDDGILRITAIKG